MIVYAIKNTKNNEYFTKSPYPHTKTSTYPKIYRYKNATRYFLKILNYNNKIWKFELKEIE